MARPESDNPQGAKHVFISYCTRNEAETKKLVQQLEAAGIPCWWSKRNIDPGQNFATQILRSIREAGAFIVVLSREANKSRFVCRETELADNCCDIFPVRIEDIEPGGGLELFLRMNQWTDAFGTEAKSNVQRLANHIKFLFEADEDVELADEARRRAPDGAAPAPRSPPPQWPLPLVQPPETEQPGGDEDEGRLPEIDEKALRDFVGPRDAWFAEQWRRIDAHKSNLSFNLPALLLGPFYFAYRKMYLWAVVYLAAYLVFWGMFTITLAEEKTALGSITFVTYLVGQFAAGFNFNRLYRLHARERAMRILRDPGDATVIRDRLQLEGGISAMAAIGAAALFVLYNTGLAEIEPQILDEISYNSTIDDGPAADAEPAEEETPPPDPIAPVENGETAAPVFADASPSVVRRTFMRNNCSHPIEANVVYLSTGGVWTRSQNLRLSGGGTWGFLKDEFDEVAMSSNSLAYFAAETTDGSELWWWEDPETSTVPSKPYRPYTMGIDEEGDYNLVLDCDPDAMAAAE